MNEYGRRPPITTEIKAGKDLIPDLVLFSKQAALEKVRSPATRKFVMATCKKLYRGVSAADADDITQEVLFKANRAVENGNFRGEAALTTWLKTIVRNTVLNHIKSKKRASGRGFANEIPEDTETAADAPSPLDMVRSKMILEAVMKELPPKAAGFLRLVAQGFSHRDIATQLGITEQVSRNWLYKIKIKYGDQIKAILK